MSEFKGTPGEWRVNDETGVLAVDGKAFNGQWKSIVDHVRGQSRTATQANARLIAAAPELLAACQSLLARFEGILRGSLSAHDAPTVASIVNSHSDVIEARAAIRKALGE